MKTVIFQLIIIEDLIKIEFKITTGDGPPTTIEKMIETKADYEAFKNDLAFGIESMDDIIKHKLKSQGNENTGDHSDDLQPVGDGSVAV